MNTLWTIAQPQKTMPNPMSPLVTIAGVEWNWMNVYSMIPGKHKKHYDIIYTNVEI